MFLGSDLPCLLHNQVFPPLFSSPPPPTCNVSCATSGFFGFVCLFSLDLQCLLCDPPCLLCELPHLLWDVRYLLSDLPCLFFKRASCPVSDFPRLLCDLLDHVCELPRVCRC